VTSQLVFTLAAPLGSFATSFSAANSAVKATVLEPTKSALVGLIGAALGYDRIELGKLGMNLAVAVRTGCRPRHADQGDFHTVTPATRPERPAGVSWTRFEEVRHHLSGIDTGGSIISRREYWSAGLWTVSVASLTTDAPSVDVLASALLSPHWLLYVGRKACALGLPPDPIVVEAEGPEKAHEMYGWPWTRRPALAEWLEPLRPITQLVPLTFDLGGDEDRALYPGAGKPIRIEFRDDTTETGVTSTGALMRGNLSRRVGIVYVEARDHRV
jgi:CRISPR system Cascade subunit CasD